MIPFGTYRRETTTEAEERGGVYAAGPLPEPPSLERGQFPSGVDEGEFAIWLPHDCDEWLIAVGTREEVIAKGREFAESVLAAVAALEQTSP